MQPDPVNGFPSIHPRYASCYEDIPERPFANLTNTATVRKFKSLKTMMNDNLGWSFTLTQTDWSYFAQMNARQCSFRIRMRQWSPESNHKSSDKFGGFRATFQRGSRRHADIAHSLI